ncbi:MAG TPA: NADH-quinone oxidoreductase subunit J [Blastocatellia bacterium]|nr:NADH-quinone oxidoreductase subunit J [Blastocatellia bacterium]
MLHPGVETYLFYLLAFTALIMAIFVVTARSAVHSALFLISTLITVAGMFVLLHAEFIMGVQILVYVGGVMVLFLFVIMLVNVKEEETESARIFTGQQWPAIILVFLLGAGFLFSMSRLRTDGDTLSNSEKLAAVTAAKARVAVVAGGGSHNTQEVGAALYNQAALPFEIASILLLVAMVGSVLLARGRRQEKTLDGPPEV